MVESSTGTRTSVTALSDVTRTSAIQSFANMELTLGCFKATRYNAITPMITVREMIIKDFFEIF